jgi:hypothetical protein
MPSFHEFISFASEAATAFGVTDRLLRNGRRLYDTLQRIREGEPQNTLPPPRIEPRTRRTLARPQVRSALILRSRDRTPPRT